MRIRARDRAPRRTTRRFALAVAAGAIAVVGAVVVTAAATSAAYTDQANMNLAGDAGVGYQGHFDIGIVLPDGTVEQADAPAGYSWPVTDAETLVPGRTVVTQIPVFNNTTDLDADTVVTLVARDGTGAVSPSVPNITPYLRFTASRADGSVLFSDAALADAHASLGTLSARGEQPLVAGDAYTPGATASSDIITLTIRYLDVAGVESLNGGQSALAVQFDAASRKP